MNQKERIEERDIIEEMMNILGENRTFSLIFYESPLFEKGIKDEIIQPIVNAYKKVKEKITNETSAEKTKRKEEREERLKILLTQKEVDFTEIKTQSNGTLIVKVKVGTFTWRQVPDSFEGAEIIKIPDPPY